MTAGYIFKFTKSGTHLQLSITFTWPYTGFSFGAEILLQSEKSDFNLYIKDFKFY